MKIGIVGLGKMGHNLALNALSKQYDVIGYDASSACREMANINGIAVVETIEDFCNSLGHQKIVWVMVPAGDATDEVIDNLSKYLGSGDIIIDGGNARYTDTLRRASQLQSKGIYLLDCGTSGGISGAKEGACLMIGGDTIAFQQVEPFFRDIAIENGYLHTGNSGSGHYLKMVHNGIEYGMMQAIGEGFEVLEASQFDYDLEKVAKVWNHGSVVRSWLMELTESAFKKDSNLSGIIGKIDANGEAQWTLEDALQLQIPTPVIALSLMMRFRSKQQDTFSGKVVAALRNEFGGHATTKSIDSK